MSRGAPARGNLAILGERIDALDADHSVAGIRRDRAHDDNRLGFARAALHRPAEFHAGRGERSSSRRARASPARWPGRGKCRSQSDGYEPARSHPFLRQQLHTLVRQSEAYRIARREAFRRRRIELDDLHALSRDVDLVFHLFAEIGARDDRAAGLPSGADRNRLRPHVRQHGVARLDLRLEPLNRMRLFGDRQIRMIGSALGRANRRPGRG